MSKKKTAIIGAAALVFASGIGFNTYAGMESMKQLKSVRDENKETKDTLELFKEAFASEIGGDVDQEDDVRIANEYEIKSTKHISDAYRSGNTDDLDDRDKETLDMAKKVLDEIIKDDMTDYEKELAVYKWMTKELSYDKGALVVVPTTQADCDNPYGVLKNHNAVCVGYATTFRLFMQMMDIECMVVHNTERYHSWDLVKLDDEWYHTDIYSDQMTGNYAHFNMSDAALKNEEAWNTEFFPAANGIKYNYGYQNRKTLKNIYDIPKAVNEMNESNEVSCSFFEFTEDVDSASLMIAELMLDTISERIGDGEEDSMFGSTEMNFSLIPKDEEGKDFYLSVSISKPLEMSDIDENLSKENMKKAMDAVDKYFPSTGYDDDSAFGFGGLFGGNGGYDDDDDTEVSSYDSVALPRG